MRRENENICTLREFKILGKGLGIKIHTVLGGPKSHHMQWNLRRLSGHELAGNEIFPLHGCGGDWGS